MLKLTATDGKDGAASEIVLVDDSNMPTPALVGLALLELTVDVLIGYAAYRFFCARS